MFLQSGSNMAPSTLTIQLRLTKERAGSELDRLERYFILTGITKDETKRAIAETIADETVSHWLSNAGNVPQTWEKTKSIILVNKVMYMTGLVDQLPRKRWYEPLYAFIRRCTEVCKNNEVPMTMFRKMITTLAGDDEYEKWLQMAATALSYDEATAIALHLEWKEKDARIRKQVEKARRNAERRIADRAAYKEKLLKKQKVRADTNSTNHQKGEQNSKNAKEAKPQSRQAEEAKQQETPKKESGTQSHKQEVTKEQKEAVKDKAVQKRAGKDEKNSQKITECLEEASKNSHKKTERGKPGDGARLEASECLEEVSNGSHKETKTDRPMKSIKHAAAESQDEARKNSPKKNLKENEEARTRKDSQTPPQGILKIALTSDKTEEDEEKVELAPALKEIMRKYPTVFSTEPSRGYQHMECTIETQKGKIVRIKQRQIPHALLEGARKTIANLEKAGYIEPSRSSWYNPIRPVQKSNGEVRITSNMQFLNNLVEDNKYSIPSIQSIFEQLTNKTCFTVIDLKDGYYQIPLKKEDRYKTAFYFENKLYQWTRMPQGFKNSPAIFQQVMDQTLAGILNKGCNVYLDDIIVYGATEEEHDKHLEQVLERLQENNLRVNPAKMQYKRREINILGAVINGRTQKPLPRYKEKAEAFKEPKSQKALQRFLGFANYFRKYLKNLGEIAAPLYELLKKENKAHIVLNEEQKSAFTKIKKALMEDMVLFLPNHSKPFILATDASDTGIGAVLYQEHNGQKEPIDWASHKLTSAERNYGITEKECLAMAWGIEHFDYYLRGRMFTVVTDHTALTKMQGKATFGRARLERMRERLQEYDFAVEYKKGEEHVDADAVSRIHEEDDLGEEAPAKEEHKPLIEKVHKETLAHRGREAVVYELQKEGHNWPGMKKDVEEYLKTCKECAQCAQKTNGGEIYVHTARPLEIVACDIMTIEHGKYLLTAIDYYTRKAVAVYQTSKDTGTVLKGLRKIVGELGIPEKLVTDAGTEFASKEVATWCREHEIAHHMVSPDKHQGNGRIERLHRNIWQVIRKEKPASLKTAITKIITKYNNTVHRAIGCTPNEAWQAPEKETLKQANSTETTYRKEFKKLHREEFNIGDAVLVEATKSISRPKSCIKYDRQGIIQKILDNDAYLVTIGEKTFKRNHAQLKGLKK